MNDVVKLNKAAALLMIFGLSQIVGNLCGLPWLQAIGAASAVAPFPKVFSDVDGIETFASRFELDYADASGASHTLEITPEVYSRITGPYNRRNVYGAALSYGPTPRFPRPLFRQVFRYGLIDPGPLRTEFGLPDNITALRLRVTTRTRGRNDKWLLTEDMP